MKSLLLVDDQPNDLRIAAEAARDVGITEISAQSSPMEARQYLEKALEGEVPLPDGIVLDLDMGHDSGFELLRFWYSTPRLSTIPVLIWSVLDREKQICELFKVKLFVSKWEGPKALREAIIQLTA